MIRYDFQIKLTLFLNITYQRFFSSNFPFFNFKFRPGINVPIFAKTLFIPNLTLGAPQTTLNVFFPSNTLQTLSLSAFGCFFTSMISTDIKLFRSSAKLTTEATSKPSFGSVLKSLINFYQFLDDLVTISM